MFPNVWRYVWVKKVIGVTDYLEVCSEGPATVKFKMQTFFSYKEAHIQTELCFCTYLYQRAGVLDTLSRRMDDRILDNLIPGDSVRPCRPWILCL